jgi:hypothetical protein
VHSAWGWLGGRTKLSRVADGIRDVWSLGSGRRRLRSPLVAMILVGRVVFDMSSWIATLLITRKRLKDFNGKRC